MSSSQTAEITGLYRYPVKGLTPEPLPRVPLRVGQTLPADRRYAIENGPSGFDPEAPQWMPKTQFLMLMRNERLAALDSRFEELGMDSMDAVNILFALEEKFDITIPDESAKQIRSIREMVEGVQKLVDAKAIQ